MKKARIMLVAIAVLGLVGGTLAFKAQKFFGATLWYATTNVGPAPCFANGTTVQVRGAVAVPLAFTSTTTTTTLGTDYFYTAGAVTVYCIGTTTSAFKVAGE